MGRIAPLRTRAQSTWGPGGPRFPPRWVLAHGDSIWRIVGTRPMGHHYSCHHRSWLMMSTATTTSTSTRITIILGLGPSGSIPC
jgi:hypothetical protein